MRTTFWSGGTNLVLRTRRVALRLVLVVLMASGAFSAELALDGVATPQTATPEAQVDAATWLARARAAMGFTRLGERVMHSHVAWADQQNYQSDRYYPPFFDAFVAAEIWFESSGGVQRVVSQTTFPGGGPPVSISLYDSAGGVAVRGERALPIASSQLRIRNLNAWAAVYDWSHAGDVRVVGREVYRDYPRVVLARKTSDGEQRLFLDFKTGFPVKLEFTEPHYLWGQHRIEYVYSNWVQQGDIQVAASSFRMADGAVEISATIGATDLITASAAPGLQMPATSAPADKLPPFLQAKPLQTSEVGPGTYLLTNPGYSEAITLADDEVFVFDATQSEERARLDTEAIAKLFPGKHKINVVVTDLAWPHVAGVRYWVAHGATIISHKAARPFLQAVVDRRWTLAPDELERQRKSAKFDFVGVDAPFKLANGSVVLAPIDGIGSEMALIGYVPGANFLWASDYIQDVSQPTAYATDVWNAAQRAGFHPQQTAAEHLRLIPWSVVEKLQVGADSTRK